MKKHALGFVVILMTILTSAHGYDLKMTLKEREDALFRLLNLDCPGLERVQAAEKAGDREAAKAALVAYYKARRNVTWYIDPDTRPKEPVKGYNTKGADRILDRVFKFIGKEATLDKKIDWDANPVNDHEWPCMFNHHGVWVALGRAYWCTHDEKYARDFNEQLIGWLEVYPRLDWRPHRKQVWRSTLRASGRAGSSWPSAWIYFQDSPSFTTEARLGMLHSLAQHAQYLMTHQGGGNWLLSESRGLAIVGIMYPEFRDAKLWAKTGIDRLYRELDAQVYPDGAQVELTPHYHGCCMSSFAGAIDIAMKNDYPLPEDFVRKYERMFSCIMYIGKPDNHIPMLNDSDHDDITHRMRDGAKRFGRKDFAFRATGGKEGEAPEATSIALNYSGFFVMRSDWTKDALYLLMDVGPYGLGHQHEDKLCLDVHAYGRSHILDPGRFTYARGKWRTYFVGTQSHSTVMVDGHGQNRRKTNRELWVIDRPLDNKWVATDDFDYAAGSYADGYGALCDVVHVRKVLFVRNDYWLVSDRLVGARGHTGEHRLQYNFQFGEVGVTVDPKTKTAASHNDDANLAVIPLQADKLSCRVAEGEEDPPCGWIGWSYHRNHKTPASMVMYEWKETVPSAMDAVLLPYEGDDMPAVSVEPLAVDAEVTGLRVSHDKGTDLILLQHRPPVETIFGEFKTDAEVALVRLDADGRVRSASFSGGAFLARASGQTLISGPKPERHEQKVTVASDDAHQVRMSWTSPTPARACVEYGYAGGGGYLFRTPLSQDAAADCSVEIVGLNHDIDYLYRALAVTDDGETVVGEGTFDVPIPMAFNFDRGTHQGWPKRGGSKCTPAKPGYGGTEYCLERAAAPTRSAHYIHANHAMRLTVGDGSRVSLAYKTNVSEPVKDFYFKISLTDDQRRWWAVYLEKAPSPEWKHVDLKLTDLRGDGPGKGNVGRTLPVGTRITQAGFTMRKGPTEQPASHSFHVDQIEFVE